MVQQRKGQIGPRFFVYLIGLLIMCLGIVLIIKADLGAAPWDVLHVGLYYQFGLTIGTWTIIVGIFILALSAFLTKQFPQVGAFLNMVLCGIFIDMYYMLPFLQTPDSLAGKIAMFLIGIVINGYGMGIYISAQIGAGPRDSLMIAISSITGWKVRNVRVSIEVAVLVIGWFLGGPVFLGTIFYGILIGVLAGICLPQCQRMTNLWLNKLKEKTVLEQKSTNRGANL